MALIFPASELRCEAHGGEGELLAKLSGKVFGFLIRTITSESQPWQQSSIFLELWVNTWH